MTIIKRLLLVLIFCAGVLPVGNQGQASVVNPTVERNGTKEFKESKIGHQRVLDRMQNKRIFLFI